VAKKRKEKKKRKDNLFEWCHEEKGKQDYKRNYILSDPATRLVVLCPLTVLFVTKTNH
jgi:hypothetical protein